MTVLVGVRCSNGVVVGADSAATSSAGNISLVRILADKIAIVHDCVIVAGTGSVGLGQRFNDIIQGNWNAAAFANSPMGWAKQMCLVSQQDFQSTRMAMPGMPQIGGNNFGAMIAAPGLSDCDLIEFEPNSMQPERKLGQLHFVTMGSGQMLAEPFLAFVSRVLWKNKIPTVEAASFGVYWALAHTIKYAPGGVGEPIAISTLTKTDGVWKARLLTEDELQEQAQHIDNIETKLGEYPWSFSGGADLNPPPIPYP